MLPSDLQLSGVQTNVSALVAPVFWLQGTLLGTIATVIAVIAVAATGMLMFFGRVDVRRGFGVVMGCFIIFGAAGIAAGLQKAVTSSEDDYLSPEPIVAEAAETPTPVAPQPVAPYDPYAGASVPQR